MPSVFVVIVSVLLWLLFYFFERHVALWTHTRLVRGCVRVHWTGILRSDSVMLVVMVLVIVLRVIHLFTPNVI